MEEEVDYLDEDIKEDTEKSFWVCVCVSSNIN